MFLGKADVFPEHVYLSIAAMFSLSHPSLCLVSQHDIITIKSPATLACISNVRKIVLDKYHHRAR